MTSISKIGTNLSEQVINILDLKPVAFKQLQRSNQLLTPRFPVYNITQFVAKNMSMAMVNKITVTILLQWSFNDTASNIIFKTNAQQLNSA